MQFHVLQPNSLKGTNSLSERFNENKNTLKGAELWYQELPSMV